MYIRPAHFDLPCADRLTQPTASQAVKRVARGTDRASGLLSVEEAKRVGCHQHYIHKLRYSAFMVWLSLLKMAIIASMSVSVAGG
jgi:hypothetical protein